MGAGRVQAADRRPGRSQLTAAAARQHRGHQQRVGMAPAEQPPFGQVLPMQSNPAITRLTATRASGSCMYTRRRNTVRHNKAFNNCIFTGVGEAALRSASVKCNYAH